jgi:small subunit ribosomal protein S9
MADEPNEEEQPPADEQPSAEGDSPAPEASSSDAPEAAAPQEGNEGEAAAEQPAAEEPAPAEAAAEEPAAPAEEPAPVEAAAPDEEPAPAEAAPPDEEPAPAAAEEPGAPAEEPAPAAAEAAAPDEPAAGEEPRRQRPPRPDDEGRQAEETVVPGAHLEPDLVLEESRPAEGEFDPYATADDTPVAEGEEAAAVEETTAPAARTPLDLAADARYRATGKRKRAIARVILKPGEGTYTVNGKGLDVYFPRATLQKHARLPLETAGYETRMDVVAKIHGGGVSSQAIALRHGIARALVEADPNLRGELKRHGFLTRDARVKERKKAGLKKARKRPQFSKR